MGDNINPPLAGGENLGEMWRTMRGPGQGPMEKYVTAQPLSIALYTPRTILHVRSASSMKSRITIAGFSTAGPSTNPPSNEDNATSTKSITSIQMCPQLQHLPPLPPTHLGAEILDHTMDGPGKYSIRAI